MTSKETAHGEARSREHLERTAERVREAGAQALVIDVDLAQPAAAQAVVGQTLSSFGRIDALLNIAGAVPQVDLFELTDEQWNAGLALKLHGARRLTLRAWEALKAANGSVVFISGSAALDPKPGFAAVATVNAAIIALAKAFAEQGIQDGVQVNSVVPGPVMTDRAAGPFWMPGRPPTGSRSKRRRSSFPDRPASHVTDSRKKSLTCSPTSSHRPPGG